MRSTELLIWNISLNPYDCLAWPLAEAVAPLAARSSTCSAVPGLTAGVVHTWHPSCYVRWDFSRAVIVGHEDCLLFRGDKFLGYQNVSDTILFSYQQQRVLFSGKALHARWTCSFRFSERREVSSQLLITHSCMLLKVQKFSELSVSRSRNSGLPTLPLSPTSVRSKILRFVVVFIALVIL